MLPSGVIAAKEKLQRGRDKLRAQHESGSPGIQVCALLTDLLDAVVLDLYQFTLDEIGAEAAQEIEGHFALVPNGGYGRRDVAPYSDVDLMLLHPAALEEELATFARKFTQHLCDAGLELGFSFRTIEDACGWALKDASVFTSLAESRLLCGDQGLFEKFTTRFRHLAQRKSKTLIQRIQEARQSERKQYGETVFLLNPNVKRSRGCLRDLQLIRWIGFARYGESDPETLMRLGFLPRQDYNNLLKARDFLLRVRNELHFQGGKSQDVLGKIEQVRIAEKYGYPTDEAMLGVERFMREYFEHTSEVRYTGAHFALCARSHNGFWAFLEPVLAHHVEGDFRVGPSCIATTRRGLAKVTSDPAEVLRLMDLANLYNKRIDDVAWRKIREAMIQRPEMVLTDEVRRRFLSLISQTGNMARMLRRLHELRVLERIVPGLSHARCLMQFNEYHKYTVDEHSFRAIEAALEFKNDPGTLGEAYRSLKNKRTLHLAILMHDLGKGFVEDHCEVGWRLADQAARQLQLPETEAEILKFLVQKHLVMAHLAQYRDVSDDQVVIQFASEVGSPDRLQMLYILTCADMAAVGPNVLNSWKKDLISQLYLRTRRHLLGEPLATFSDQELGALRTELRKLCSSDEQASWWDQRLKEIPAAYLMGTPRDQLFRDLERLRQLPRNEAVAWSRYLPEHQAVEYSVGTYEQITPGIFHKLTGALTSKGLQILSADINTLSGELVLDRFYVQDQDFADEPPADRREEICQALVQALKAPADAQPTFRRIWQAPGTAPPTSPRLPTQVRVDNDASERFTLVDVFAHDRMGLLYAITRSLFEAGLSVHGARIGTHLDQVVDVFYVTDQAGKKVQDPQRLETLRQRVLLAIETKS